MGRFNVSLLYEHLCAAHPVFSKLTEEEKAPIITLLRRETNDSKLKDICQELGYIKTDPEMRQACFDSLPKEQKKKLIDQVP